MTDDGPFIETIPLQVKCAHCSSDRLLLDGKKGAEMFPGDAQITLSCEACKEQTVVRVFDDRQDRGVFVHTIRPRKGGGWKQAT
jgi:hypothetical protein